MNGAVLIAIRVYEFIEFCTFYDNNNIRLEDSLRPSQSITLSTLSSEFDYTPS